MIYEDNIEEDSLQHIGTATSGRYPKGSGKANKGKGLFGRKDTPKPKTSFVKVTSGTDVNTTASADLNLGPLGQAAFKFGNSVSVKDPVGNVSKFLREQSTKVDMKRAVSNGNKRTRDLSDAELQAKYARVVRDQELMGLANSKALDRQSREKAKQLFENRDSMDPAELSREQARLKKRNETLKKLQPSNNAKLENTIIPKQVVAAIKAQVASEKNVEKVMDWTSMKVLKKKPSGMVRTIVKGVATTGSGKIFDAVANKAYATYLDTKGDY